MIERIFSKQNVLLVFLILCLSLPRSLQIYKYFALAILVIHFVKNFRIKKSYLTYVVVLLGIFIVPLLIGVLYNNEAKYIIGSLKSNILFPIGIMTILQCYTKLEILAILQKASRISLIIILVILLSTVLNAFHLFPYNFNEFFYPEETHSRITGGYFHFINSSLSYLIFIIPLVFIPRSKNKITIIVFVLLLVVVILTGRRILVLPFLVVLVYEWKRFALPLLVFLACLALPQTNKIIDTQIVSERFVNAINSKGDSNVKAEQSEFFVKNIIRKPLFGYGLGSYMKEYTRNDEYQTAYERSFHYQVFSLGIIFTFMLWFFYAYLSISVYTNNNIYIGFILGIVSLLMSSYTNPYWLSSFDYCIPLALLMRFAQNECYGESV